MLTLPHPATKGNPSIDNSSSLKLMPTETMSPLTGTYQDSKVPRPTIQKVQANENQAITQTDDRLDDTNWTIWHH